MIMKKSILILILSFYTLNLSCQTFTNYTSNDGLASDFVECIAVDIYDNIWFGTSSGIQMFDGINWTLYTISDFNGLITNNIKVTDTITKLKYIRMTNY